MNGNRLRTIATGISLAAALVMSASSLQAWGGPGHRLVGLVAFNHLSATARQNVAWLLGKQSLADVAGWADSRVTDEQQTAPWHYLNIPPEATGYDRDRDCPRQPGVAAGSRADKWRDCAVDRITYFEQLLADPKLDQLDRGTALKYLVHFIGDLHQPFHALGVGRGGNDVIVKVFGSANCSNDPARTFPCNLHSVWDSRLLAHRGLDEAPYLIVLERLIAEKHLAGQPAGTPEQWAVESWTLGKAALVAPGTDIDEAYYKTHISVIETRLALAGVRLAAVLNRVLVALPDP
ncbi:MAG: S1/P1 nuclease [Vicinamibacterales bacterium]